jgi:hypothetical protein
LRGLVAAALKKSDYFLIPALACLAVFWRAPFVWFRTDDFAWLGLRLEVHGLRSLASALFLPEAQGTVRVLSERLFFLLFSSVFGMHAAPFRWFALLTWFLALALGGAVGAKITGSRTAGIAAAVVWTTSFAVAVPLMWSSAYNQILCSFLLLAALYARARRLESLEPETGNTKWQIVEWVAYLAGFGALEVTVMYPLAALLYTSCVARKRDRRAWALLIPAVIFGAMHWLAIARPAGDVYRVVVDGRIVPTALFYLRSAWGPDGFPLRWAIGAALAAFFICRMASRDARVLFPAAWFALFIAPVLPLPNHILYYELTIPLIGMAWLGGWALERAWNAGGLARAVSIGLAAAFLAGSLPEINAETADWLARTSRMRLVVRGAQAVAAAYPGTALIFKGVDQNLFDTGFEDEPFRLFGVTRVYLAPGSGELRGSERFRISADDAAKLIDRGQARVLEVSADAAPSDVTGR